MTLGRWTAAFALCWLALGLWVLSDGARRARVTGRAASPTGALGARLLSLGVLAATATPLAAGLGAGLGAVALLLLAMLAASLAVVGFSFWPRAYAASVLAAGLVVIVTGWR